jgi:predicted GNAT family acetyltransferase
MEIQHQTEAQHPFFFIKDGDEIVAKIEYNYTDNSTITIYHTEVNEKLKGMNIGNKLLQKVIELARTEHKKIIPLCSYALAMFKKKEEYQDVWK